MTASSWHSNLRFVLAACIAFAMGTLAVMAPRWARNDDLRQQCWRQQYEMIALEQQNDRRRALLERIQHDPAFKLQFIAETAPDSAQLITVPEGLALHPDALMRETAANSTDPLPRQTGVSAWVLRWARVIDASTAWQHGLLGLAATVLIFGSGTWTRVPCRKWSRNLTGQLRRWGQRYLVHSQQSPLAGPHWNHLSSEATEPQNREDNTTPA